MLIDDDESLYFTYADNGGIRMAKMDSMLTVDTKSTPRLNNTSIGGWTEGSYILKRDGVYYLTYTGNHVASDGYRIAYSTANAITTSEGGIDKDAFTRAEKQSLGFGNGGSAQRHRAFFHRHGTGYGLLLSRLSYAQFLGRT